MDTIVHCSRVTYISDFCSSEPHSFSEFNRMSVNLHSTIMVNKSTSWHISISQTIQRTIRMAILIWINMAQHNEDNVGVSLWVCHIHGGEGDWSCCVVVFVYMCLRGYGPSCTEDIEWLALHRRPGGKGANQLIALADLNFQHICTGHFIPTYVIAKGRRCCRRDMCTQFLYAISGQKGSSTQYNKKVQ